MSVTTHTPTDTKLLLIALGVIAITIFALAWLTYDQPPQIGSTPINVTTSASLWIANVGWIGNDNAHKSLIITEDGDTRKQFGSLNRSELKTILIFYHERYGLDLVYYTIDSLVFDYPLQEYLEGWEYFTDKQTFENAVPIHYNESDLVPEYNIPKPTPIPTLDFGKWYNESITTG